MNHSEITERWFRYKDPRHNLQEIILSILKIHTMTRTIEICNPLTDSKWDRHVSNNEMSTVFHTSLWQRVLVDAYRFKPHGVCIAAPDAGNAVIPFMEVRDIVQRKKGVCLPFSDFCPPLVENVKDFTLLFEHIKEYGKQQKWHSITFKGWDCFSETVPVASCCYGHELSIAGDIPALFTCLRSSTQRNILKAEKAGITIHVGNSESDIRQFYRLNCITRKRHGLPPQPFSFFQKLYKNIISNGSGIVALAFIGTTCISGAVYFHSGKKVLYKYGASEYKYQYLRANNLLMWEAIKYYNQKGFHILQLGKTELHNTGLRQFKQGWRGKEYLIKNYTYHYPSQRFIQVPSKVKGIHTSLFAHMPQTMLRLMGTVLYRYMG